MAALPASRRLCAAAQPTGSSPAAGPAFKPAPCATYGARRSRPCCSPVALVGDDVEQEALPRPPQPRHPGVTPARRCGDTAAHQCTQERHPTSWPHTCRFPHCCTSGITGPAAPTRGPEPPNQALLQHATHACAAGCRCAGTPRIRSVMPCTSALCAGASLEARTTYTSIFSSALCAGASVEARTTYTSIFPLMPVMRYVMTDAQNAPCTRALARVHRVCSLPGAGPPVTPRHRRAQTLLRAEQSRPRCSRRESHVIVVGDVCEDEA